MNWTLAGLVAAASLVAAAPGLGQNPADPRPGGPAVELSEGLDPALEALVAEVLERNPSLARARFQVAAAHQRAPQAGSLPDPSAEVSLFALPPETRVGPQRLNAFVSQQLPARGKRALRASMLEREADAEGKRLEARRLELVTETRRHYYELAYLEARGAILHHENEHLAGHERLARTRYASGAGLQQGVIKMQAAITRSEQRMVELKMMQKTRLAALNRLRDRPAQTPVELGHLPKPYPLSLDGMALRQQAASWRPELEAAAATRRAAGDSVRLAGKESSPDFSLGLGYTLVDRRQDDIGRTVPPQGNGNDILTLRASVRLPVWNRRLSAMLEESLASESAAGEAEREAKAEIEAEIGELEARIPLLYEQWYLFEDVLREQAEEALRSAESAYATGRLNALDLLESEHMLFDVHTGGIRAQADWAIAWAELEGAVGGVIELGEVQHDES